MQCCALDSKTNTVAVLKGCVYLFPFRAFYDQAAKTDAAGCGFSLRTQRAAEKSLCAEKRRPIMSKQNQSQNRQQQQAQNRRNQQAQQKQNQSAQNCQNQQGDDDDDCGCGCGR